MPCVGDSPGEGLCPAAAAPARCRGLQHWQTTVASRCAPVLRYQGAVTCDAACIHF